MRDFWAPRRIVMAAIGVLIVVWCATALNWTWLADPKYQALILRGIWNTIWLLVVTMVLGMLLAMAGLVITVTTATRIIAVTRRTSGVLTTFWRTAVGGTRTGSSSSRGTDGGGNRSHDAGAPQRHGLKRNLWAWHCLHGSDGRSKP